MALPLRSTIAGSLRLTATLLETTAGVLRHLAGTPGAELIDAVPAAEASFTEAAAAPAASETPHAHAGTTPARATRSQITDPKAARKARQRAGS